MFRLEAEATRSADHYAHAFSGRIPEDPPPETRSYSPANPERCTLNRVNPALCTLKP
jgi:hypothetical protein